jgi:hypothetical protein
VWFFLMLALLVPLPVALPIVISLHRKRRTYVDIFEVTVVVSIGPSLLPIGPSLLSIGPSLLSFGPSVLPTGPSVLPTGPFELPIGPFELPISSLESLRSRSGIEGSRMLLNLTCGQLRNAGVHGRGVAD